MGVNFGSIYVAVISAQIGKSYVLMIAKYPQYNSEKPIAHLAQVYDGKFANMPAFDCEKKAKEYVKQQIFNFTRIELIGQIACSAQNSLEKEELRAFKPKGFEKEIETKNQVIEIAQKKIKQLRKLRKTKIETLFKPKESL